MTDEFQLLCKKIAEIDALWRASGETSTAQSRSQSIRRTAGVRRASGEARTGAGGPD
jgi:hypothetical protein